MPLATYLFINSCDNKLNMDLMLMGLSLMCYMEHEGKTWAFL